MAYIHSIQNTSLYIMILNTSVRYSFCHLCYGLDCLHLTSPRKIKGLLHSHWEEWVNDENITQSSLFFQRKLCIGKLIADAGVSGKIWNEAQV